MKLLFLTLILLSVACVQQTVFHESTGRTYIKANYEGWNFYINEELTNHKDWPRAKLIIRYQLFRITTKLNDEVVKHLQDTAVYIDIKREENGSAEYHPSKRWLIENGISAKKAHCIEITGLEEFVEFDKHMPWVLLHELMHSYHHQVLTFEHPEILRCFTKARKKKKYNDTMFVDGRARTHYASSNHKEYFAEAAEAYFGVNDYFPFVQAELMEYDPAICNFLKTLARQKKEK